MSDNSSPPKPGMITWFEPGETAEILPNRIGEYSDALKVLIDDERNDPLGCAVDSTPARYMEQRERTKLALMRAIEFAANVAAVMEKRTEAKS